MGGSAGKILAPADARHDSEPDAVELFEATPELLGWRKKLCQTNLEGFVREVVASSELLEIDDKHVLLRPRSHAFVSESLTTSVSKAFTKAVGHDFTVTFDAEECAPDAPSVSRLEQAERIRAQRALVAAFRSDPFVKKILETFDAVLDESTVRTVETKEKAKK